MTENARCWLRVVALLVVVVSAVFRLADERAAPIEAMTTALVVRVASGELLPPVRLLVTGTRIR